MYCYLSKNYKGIASAGNKAKTDIEAIMARMGFRNVGLRQTTSTNEVYAFILTLIGVLLAAINLRSKDYLVLQYPLKKYFTFVCKIHHLRGGKVIVIIHDLGSFRRKALTIEKEIRRLNNADVIIAHNESMKAWLEEHGCKAQLTTLGIFDYLSTSKPQPLTSSESHPFSVLYAGALNYRKNTFLYHFGSLARHFNINLYGSGFELDKAEGKEQISYMGFVKSDELIATAKGDFGLVWDGESTESCQGNFGEYLKFNNPHKTSLYLRSGLPVIIWKQAALAPFIQKHKVGICIRSLGELDEILANLSQEAYQEMRRNALEMSQRLEEGFFVKQALEHAIRILEETENIG